MTVEYGCLDVCLDLSPAKPLNQSKNVIVRTFHKLREDRNGQKIGQKVPKNTKKSHVTEPGEAGETGKAEASGMSKNLILFKTPGFRFNPGSKLKNSGFSG